MAAHRVLSKTITPSSGETVEIKYWAEDARIYVAGFDESDRMVTATTYSGEVTIADDLYDKLRQSLIATLVGIIEQDLLTNPHLHYRKRG